MMKSWTLLLLFLFLAVVSNTQSVTLPPSGNNSKSVVTQYMGSLSSVTVTYNSVDVTASNGTSRDGQIWGQLVPYGLTNLGYGLGNPSPWRAGSNENTTIEFSHDVEVEGKALKAGKYGLHLIVEESGPWTWIFSHNSTAWGSFFYDKSEDALRVQSVPEEAQFTEWLNFTFTERLPESCVLELQWERKAVPMRISVPGMSNLYVANIRRELQGSAAFSGQNFQNAATYCANNGVNLEEALTWAERAISDPFVGRKDFGTLQTKASVLFAMEKSDEANEVMLEAIKLPSAGPSQVHAFGRQLITMGKTEKAMEVFKYNYDNFDAAWPTKVGMARGLSALGKYKEALPYAEKALAEAPDDLNRQNLERLIGMLKNGEDIN